MAICVCGIYILIKKPFNKIGTEESDTISAPEVLTESLLEADKDMKMKFICFKNNGPDCPCLQFCQSIFDKEMLEQYQQAAMQSRQNTTVSMDEVDPATTE